MTTTVGELILQLKSYPIDWEITFGPNPSLSFNRLRQRGEKMVNMQFNETAELASIYPEKESNNS